MGRFRRITREAILCAIYVLLFCDSVSARAWEEERRDVMLFDLYHRQPVYQELAEGHLQTGYFNSMAGRYLPYDRAHGNGYALFRLLFNENYVFRTAEQPLTLQILEGVDVLVLINPDSKAYLPAAHLLVDSEIDAIVEFVRNGGGLFITANSWTRPETFELEQTNKLLRQFGVEFEPTWTPYFKCSVPEDSPFLFNVSTLHYGGGCTIKVLDNMPGVPVDVILSATRNEMKRSTIYPAGHGDTPLGEGPIVTLSRYGKGRVIAVGDSGTWALDDLAVSGTDNLQILEQLVRLLRTPRLDFEYRPKPVRGQHHRVEVTWFIAGPDPDLLDIFDLPQYVKKQVLPPQSWPTEFRYYYGEFKLEKDIGPKTIRGNTPISLKISALEKGRASEIGTATLLLAPKGQILKQSRGQRKELPNRIDLLDELMDMAAVTFSDPLLGLGSTWENDLWMRILPLEPDRGERGLRKVKAKHTLDSLEERGNIHTAKVVSYGFLDLKDIDISQLVSSVTMRSRNLGKLNVEQGMQVMERIQYFDKENGDLLEAETHTYSRIWLTGMGFAGDDHGYVQLYERILLRPAAVIESSPALALPPSFTPPPDDIWH